MEFVVMEASRSSEDSTDHLPAEANWDEDEGEDEGEGLDPRVQDELESLNSAAESINRLENEVQKARGKFRLMKSESTQRLRALSKKIGSRWISKSRPYYDLLTESQKAQLEAQKATIKFQKANSFYTAAKETVTLAEIQVVTEDGAAVSFDSAWQEMLNHATMKFMDAEKEKAACELEHELRAKEYASIQQKVNFFQKEMPRAINRAKAFYDLKETLQLRLQAERQNAEDLHLALICSKQKYKMALNSLENISEDIHQSRRNRIQMPLWRTPGVGAESDACSEMSDMPSVNLDFMSETASQVSFDDFADDGSWSPQLDLDLALEDEPSSREPETPPISKEQSTRKMSSDVGTSNGLSQIWARLGNGLTRMTQDIGKTSSTTGEKLEGKPGPNGGMERDDTVDGAEDQGVSEQVTRRTSEPLIKNRRIIRSTSCERLIIQQMSVVNLGATDPTDSSSSQKVTGKPPIYGARRMSVSSLKSGVYVTQTVAPPPPSEKQDAPKSSSPTKKPEVSAGQQFPILYDLKSTNQKGTTSSWKPVSFMQSLQGRGTPSATPKGQASPLRVPARTATPAPNQMPAKPSSVQPNGKSSNAAEPMTPKGEEIFV